MKFQELFDDIKARYQSLRVGQAIYVAHGPTRSHHSSTSARVVGVGRKWIRLAGGAKVEARDIIDWWHE